MILLNINVLIVISCICILFVIGRIFIIPVKKILKLVFNSILGGILIWLINLIGGIWGFHIGLNLYTSILVRTSWGTRCDIFDYSETIDSVIGSVKYKKQVVMALLFEPYHLLARVKSLHG